MPKTIVTIFSILVLAVFITTSIAEIPNVIKCQGRVTDDAGLPITGSESLKFKIYGSAAGDDSLWSSGFQTVQIDDGLFNYDLGLMVSLPQDLFSVSPRYLGITVGADLEMSPRVEMTSSAFSFLALRSDSSDYAKTIAYDCVTSDKIQDDAITGNDLAHFTIESFHIQDATITFNKIGTNSASDGQVMKMIGGNWTAADDETGSGGGDITAVLPGSGLSGGGTSGEVTLSVGTSAITSSHIALYGVGTNELAHYSVTNVKIADGAISTNKIASNSILSDKISNTAVITEKLANNAVTSPKILDGTITSNDIANSTIDSTDIANSGISLGDIAQSGASESQAITWHEGAWEPVTAGDITSVTGAELGGLIGGGDAGDVELGIEYQGVNSYFIQDNSIMDEDINSSANISPDKINGTAVTLSGDHLIEGTNTFTNLNIGTTTRRFALSSAAFTPGKSSYSFSRNSTYLINTATIEQSYFAQVSLPSGATVTNVRVTIHDNDGTYDCYAELIKVYMITGSDIVMANMTSSGTPGLTTMIDSDIYSETVSNDGYAYYLMASMHYSSGANDMRLYGAEIEYTITKPLP